MNIYSDCIDAYGNDLGSLTMQNAMAGGIETFVFNAGSQAGVCAINSVNDYQTSIPSNPVTITVL
jgi:hypothetical protein